MRLRGAICSESRACEHEGWPHNPTVCSPDYDPTRWLYRCDHCGATAAPVSVVPADGGLVFMPPEGWR